MSKIDSFLSINDLNGLIYVRYLDHVSFNRTSALSMKPQIREAVGWLVYENDQYLTLTWDRDAEPPTLKGGDPKGSGLVLLKEVILELKRFTGGRINGFSENILNSKRALLKPECALQPIEAKNSKKREKTESNR